MRNRSSSVFQKTAAEISAVLERALRNQPGYIRSDVVQLEPGSVQATVNNVFGTTNATQESVNQAINQAAANSDGLLKNATFTPKNLCEQQPLPCDVSSTMCTNTNGRAVCSCKEGYISIVYSNTSCRACPSGQRAVGDACQPCAFGYAGFNCNDSALLAVVVISCVLGGTLLILILALLIFCCWTRCSENKSDFSSSSPYSSNDVNQPWPTGVTPIPRATSNWDAAAPIEMTEGGSTHALVDKKPQSNGLSGSYDLNTDGMKTFKGRNPSRYSYLVQGHENPYFLPGDERKN
ncbi:protein HEG homolog 1 [Stegastes partitus]|uniref:Protein HEG homolog 1 n=1 Tax=Stegastes partitus TaxID=144197 RepID=A0A9Y4TRI4_9TELE|nr:PREDICTED: protein HEG homolog 1-like [Stegastes partitus]